MNITKAIFILVKKKIRILVNIPPFNNENLVNSGQKKSCDDILEHTISIQC